MLSGQVYAMDGLFSLPLRMARQIQVLSVWEHVSKILSNLSNLCLYTSCQGWQGYRQVSFLTYNA
jgi:hypothetical protein